MFPVRDDLRSGYLIVLVIVPKLFGLAGIGCPALIAACIALFTELMRAAKWNPASCEAGR
jgi:hypothetical protein